MKIKSKKIYIFNDSEYESYKVCCDFLNKCHIEFDSYSALDDDDNRVWCIEWDCL